MTVRMCLILLSALLASCASEPPPPGPTEGFEELNSMQVLDAPTPVPGNFAPENRYMVERGEYLVELLGCGSCHTDGALEGAPRMDKALAGSGIGIAYMNPFGNDRPGVVYPPNITPDPETGIGDWSDQQIAEAAGQRQSHLFFGQPIGAYGAGVASAVARIEHDDVEFVAALVPTGCGGQRIAGGLPSAGRGRRPEIRPKREGQQ